MNSITGKHGYLETCSRLSLCTDWIPNLMFFVSFSFLVIFIYDFSASSSWIFLRLLRSLRIPPVTHPAAPLDLSVLLDLLGLLRVAALLFSGSSVPIHERYSLLWDLAPVLSVCYYLRTVNTKAPRVWS